MNTRMGNNVASVFNPARSNCIPATPVAVPELSGGELGSLGVKLDASSSVLDIPSSALDASSSVLDAPGIALFAPRIALFVSGIALFAPRFDLFNKRFAINLLINSHLRRKHRVTSKNG